MKITGYNLVMIHTDSVALTHHDTVNELFSCVNSTKKFVVSFTVVPLYVLEQGESNLNDEYEHI